MSKTENSPQRETKSAEVIQRTRATLEYIFIGKIAIEMIDFVLQKAIQNLVDLQKQGEIGIYGAMYEEIKESISSLLDDGISPNSIYELLAPRLKKLRLALQPGTVMPLSQFDQDFQVIAGPMGWRPRAIYTTTG